MAEDATDLEDVLKRKGDRLLLDIEVKPGSAKSGLTGFDPWRKRIIVSVRAQAIKGKANKEVMEVVSDALGIGDVVIESGHTGRLKTVSFMVETDVDSVYKKLRSLLN